MTYSTVKLSLNINATNYLGSAVVECFMAMLVDRKTLWGNVEVTGFEPRPRRTYNGHSERLTHSNCRVGLGTCDRSRHPGPPPWLADPSRPYSCCRSCADSLRPFLWHALRGSPSWMNLQSLLFTWAKKWLDLSKSWLSPKKKVRREISGGAFVFRKPGCCILLLLEKNRSQRSFVLIGIRDLRKKICFGLHRQTLSVFSISRLSTIFFSLKSSFSLSLLVAERGFFLSLLKNKTTCFGSNLTKNHFFLALDVAPKK